MTAADAILVLLGASTTAYALFGGADFGAGWWDLTAGGAKRGAPHRRLIEHTLGPVWEANHVWLIFTLVLLWTGFPSVFGAIGSTMYIPLTAAGLGIIGRGAGFAFRKASVTVGQKRLFGGGFALSSVLTPFFFGTAAGGIASGRVPAGIGEGNLVTAWWNPTSIMAGLLATGVSAYLAAVFLTRDAQREAPELVDGMRKRALGSGVLIGALAVVGLLVVRADAPRLAEQLFGGWALALVVVSVLAGAASMALLVLRHFVLVRLTASLAAASVLWAWGAASYPELLPGVTVDDAAATPAVLHATLWVVAFGSLLLVPSLWWLYKLFQSPPPVRRETPSAPGSDAEPDGAAGLTVPSRKRQAGTR